MEDRRVALKRFWPEARAAEMEEAVSNDSGLAGATKSEVSAGLRRWCERGSWGACPECGIPQARPLHQQPSPSPAASAAAAASSHTSQSLRTCLSRFGGSHQKYLRHSVYQRLTSEKRSGPPTPVVWRQATASTAKCCASPGRTARRKARAAYRFLKHSEDSTYAYHLQEHKKFLAKHAEEGATERQRLRPMQEIGVECAIWPDLHWTTDVCDARPASPRPTASAQMTLRTSKILRRILSLKRSFEGIVHGSMLATLLRMQHASCV